MRAEQTWSLLDPRPIILYLDHLDEYIVYWNGMAMTHSQALCMTMERIGIYATPEMKSAMQSTFERIYYANGFGTRAWDDKVKSTQQVYEWQKYKMKEHITKVVKDKNPAEILEWFNYNRSRKEEHE